MWSNIDLKIREDLDIIEKKLNEELNALSAPTVLYLATKEDAEFRHMLNDTRTNHKQVLLTLILGCLKYLKAVHISHYTVSVLRVKRC